MYFYAIFDLICILSLIIFLRFQPCLKQYGHGNAFILQIWHEESISKAKTSLAQVQHNFGATFNCFLSFGAPCPSLPDQLGQRDHHHWIRHEKIFQNHNILVEKFQCGEIKISLIYSYFPYFGAFQAYLGAPRHPRPIFSNMYVQSYMLLMYSKLTET